MLEELVKIVPLFIILKIFPQEFNEPIDYLGFAAFSALGFSAAENILYFDNYGSVMWLCFDPDGTHGVVRIPAH